MIKDKTEELFMDTMIKLGKTVVPTTKEVDMFDHIDIFCDGIGYDVKGIKKLRRHHKDTNPDIVWVEMRNIKGNDGWLKGKADYIAFYNGTYFYIVNREKLLNFTREYVGFPEIIIGSKIQDPVYKKLYRRFDQRLELTTFLYYSDIEHLIEEKYEA